MKKFLLVMGLCAAACTACYADQIYMIQTDSNAASIIDNIEVKTKDATQKTGSFMKENAQKAGNATKKGACKAGKAAKKEAIKAGKAAKKGAKKATNWSAQKIKDGAEVVIEKTQDVPSQVTTVETVESVPVKETIVEPAENAQTK